MGEVVSEPESSSFPPTGFGGTVFLVFWNRICFMDVVKMDALEAGYGPPCQENPYLPPFCKAVEV